jgi:beta-glucanase (GH16 family)
MKTIYLPVIIFIFTLSVYASESKLVWSDEFNYTGLPDKTKWDYEEGFVRNREMQFYTRGRKQNARVENGVLTIEGRKENFPNPKYTPDSKNWRQKRKSAEYTSASLITLNKAAWKYGRIEVRAKLPRGKGVWPAIWMMGENRPQVHWPACGEIDIMEYIGRNTNTVYATVHYPSDRGKHKSNGKHITTQKPYNDFHIYAIEWDSDKIEFFFDNRKYHTFNIDDAGKGEDNPFRKPQYLLINLALGGSWGRDIDDTILPAQYQIDYVRIYEEIPTNNQRTTDQ